MRRPGRRDEVVTRLESEAVHHAMLGIGHLHNLALRA